MLGGPCSQHVTGNRSRQNQSQSAIMTNIRSCQLTASRSHSRKTSSNGNISRVTGLCAGNSPVTVEFPSQRQVTRSFDVFFDLRQNKRLSKQSWGCWFETPSRSLWRQCNVPAQQRTCHCCNSPGIPPYLQRKCLWHYSDGIMSAMASQINGGSIFCSTVCSCAYQRKH